MTLVACSSYLQPILHLRYYRILGEECEELPLPGEGHGNDQAHEEAHFEHEQDEDLQFP